MRAPRAGSDFYRGLGSVILGGLAVSTVFTLFIIPSLLAFFIPFEKSRRDRCRHHRFLRREVHGRDRQNPESAQEGLAA